MRRLWKGIREFTRRGDLLLLLLCVVTSVFGLVMVASTTHWSNSSRFVIVQGVALILGVLLYMLISVIDIEIFADHRVLLMVFSTVIMLMLRRWGIEVNGNRAWLSLPFLPVNIQPAEICKITFIIILAKILSDRRAHISAPKTVGSATALTLYFVGLIIVLSHDVHLPDCCLRQRHPRLVVPDRPCGGSAAAPACLEVFHSGLPEAAHPDAV